MHAHEIQAAFDTNESTADEILQLIECGEPYRDILDQIATILGLEVIELEDDKTQQVVAEAIEQEDDDQPTIIYNLDSQQFELVSVNVFTGDDGGDVQGDPQETAIDV